MLEIKSTPPHNFDVDIKLNSEVDPEYMIGRIGDKGNVIENEIEAIIDGKEVVIKLLSCFKQRFVALPALNFILRASKGMDGKQVQQILCKKYGRQIQPNEEILIYQYELLELGN